MKQRNLKLVVVCGCDPQTHYECGCMEQGRGCPYVLAVEEVADVGERHSLGNEYMEKYPNAYVHTWSEAGEYSSRS